MKVIIVSGMSGAGKSITLRALEDCDFYCMDNLPIHLLSELLDQHITGKNATVGNKIAIGIGVSGLQYASSDDLRQTIASFKERGANIEILFLGCEDKTLLKRYIETRRLHPISSFEEDLSVEQCIQKERGLLDGIASIADTFIDTSELTPAQLSARVSKTLCEETGSINLTIQSFGYKKGIPTNSDYVFDVRYMTNPYWHANLRLHSGEHKDVVHFIEQDPQSTKTVQSIYDFLKYALAHFSVEARKYITVSIGCTGGFHRSVYVVNSVHKLLSEELSPKLWNINKLHRDL